MLKLKLSELVEAAGLDVKVTGGNPVVTSVTDDSRRVEPGCMFVATKGVNVDSHLFISDAIEKGAVAIVTEQPVAPYNGIAILEVSDSRDALGRLAHAAVGNPSHGMLVLGVTGTNGKTTSAYLLEAILTAAGYNTAVLGTIEYRFAGQTVEANNTTPSASKLATLFSEMKQAGVNAVAMELSSHAADQRRISGIKFDGCIITNITQDHLDYHGTMEKYSEAKKKIFTDYLQRDQQYKSGPVISVLNVDDSTVKSFAPDIPGKVLTISIDEPSDYRATDISFTTSKTEFYVQVGDTSVEFHTHLVGMYNVQNVLGTIALSHGVGIPLEAIRNGLDALEVVPGRLETVREGQPFLVLVDYAHTPDALERVLTNARAMSSGKLIVVFGCGGDRDPGKRPIMGNTAGTLADIIFVTNDNPRTEDPANIANQVLKGVQSSPANPKNIQVELDRRKAITSALKIAQADDIVVIAGKGHEDYQIIGKEKVHFDDRQEARNFLRNAAGADR